MKKQKQIKVKITALNTYSSLVANDLTKIINDFQIDPRYDLLLPGETDTIMSAPEGYEPVYLHFLMGGLRFPVDPFILDVLQDIGLHLSQLLPNSLRKIIGFIMVSRSLGIPLNVKLFRYFYTVTGRNDWAIIALRQGRSECIMGLKDSIHNWKYGFFFVNSLAFSGNKLPWGKVTGRGSDPAPELSDEEESQVRKMASVKMEWDDPDEVFLGMADLSPFYFNRGIRPLWIVDGENISLLQRLQMSKASDPPGDIIVSEGAITPFLQPQWEIYDSDNTRSFTETDSLNQHAASITQFSTEDTMDIDSQSGSILPRKVKSTRNLSSHGKEKNIRRREQIQTTPIAGKRVKTTDEGLHDCPVISQNPVTTSTFSDVHPIVSFKPSSLIIPPIMTSSISVPQATSVPSLPWKPPTFPSSTAALSMFGSRLFSSSMQTSSTTKSSSSCQSTNNESSPAVPIIHQEASGPKPTIPTFDEILKETSGSEPSTYWTPRPKTVSTTGTLTVSQTSPIPTTTQPQAMQNPALQNIQILPDEEIYIRAKAGMLNTIELLSEIESRNQRREIFVKERDQEFTRIIEITERVKAMHEKDKAESSKLKESLKHLSEQNTSINHYAKELETKIKVLTEASKTGETKLKEMNQKLSDTEKQLAQKVASLSAKEKELDEIKTSADAQISSLKNEQSIHLSRIAEVESNCTEKENQLQKLQNSVAEIERSHQSTEEENLILKKTIAEQSQLLDERSSDIIWLMQKGIPGVVKVFLSSDEFVHRNAALQLETLKFGQYKGCLDMKDRYPDLLKTAEMPHDYPQGQEVIVGMFSDLVGSNYSLLKSCESGVLSLGELKSLVTSSSTCPPDAGESSNRGQNLPNP